MKARGLACLLATTAVMAIGAPAHAGLMDAPPKLYTFKLDDPSETRLTLLQAFHDAEVERPGPVKNYLIGPWGRWAPQPWWTLAWGEQQRDGTNDDAAQDADGLVASLVKAAEGLRFDAGTPSWLARLDPTVAPPVLASTGVTFDSNGFDALWQKPVKKITDWRCRRRPVRFIRYGAETDSFELVHCDGSIAPEAFDRLTIIARPPEVPKPGELLPDEPDPESWARHEWAPGVHLVAPRLLWALQRVSDAFPWRAIYVFSGYRPNNQGSASGSHHSMHAEARAMDISIMGIRNEDLFRFCRTLDDVGCGFYPNSKFVHVDVRKPGTGHAFWVDDSGPGERSHYVDGWPGVVEHGALVWNAKLREKRAKEAAEAADAGTEASEAPPAP